MTLSFLDTLLEIVHTFVVLAFLTLWVHRRTRPAHLLLVLLTAASWLGLGAIYGFGYCFLTDWHWQIKRALGQSPPGSFIEYGAEALLGRKLPSPLVDALTAAVAAAVAVVSGVLNLRDRARRRANR